VKRDIAGKVHLGGDKTAKSLFGRRGSGCKNYTKIWQVLSLIYRLLSEGKMATQREAYYCLVQNFKDQNEFNCILQDVVALTQCSRSSLGISASGSGYIAGLVLWKETGSDPYDCSTSDSGKQIPGVVSSVEFESLGARYILVVEKDAVFTYLCGQRIWNSLPCVLITGCGYPPLSVRAVTRKIADLLHVPVLGLFDYNPHGVRILMTYKFGSARMGTESHAYAVDMKWLGVHYSDLFDGSGEALVASEALQPWTISDARVFSGIYSSVESLTSECPFFLKELRLMEGKKVKAEIEAINRENFDSLETLIIHKTLHRLYI
jgi:meiotic recombination protein SPO11